MRNKMMWIGVVVGVGLLLAAAGIVLAGSLLNPTAGPGDPASQMYTLEQIYTRLSGGGDATKMITFTEPTAGPTVGTMHTLDEIYALALPARVPKTGQTTSYAPGDDGALRKGVVWPNPRFITGTTGVVTDTLTELIWLKNANCTTFFSGDSTGQNIRSWANAITAANSLANGYCGLTDDSVTGDWRLPNVREMQSLVHVDFSTPAVPNTAGTGQWTEGNPFTGVQPFYYWTSTTYAFYPSNALYVDLTAGNVNSDNKTWSYYVWPVRGGQ
jgi:hypothetical protein